VTLPLLQNTKAILLLTAPLLAGQTRASAPLLSVSEYTRLERHLNQVLRAQPEDLLRPGSHSLLLDCRTMVAEDRLAYLLGRAFLLSQAVERWQSRGIWVASRSDAQYPLRLQERLRENAPLLLYGCGEHNLMQTGGLAVVGSRDASPPLLEYATNVGQLTAYAGRTVVSGGARGIDRAAMTGALEAGGRTVGVLASDLEKMSMNREFRSHFIDGRLSLISPFDPGVGFAVGNAMQRNKLIYGLADAALVVSSNVNSGGTWAGAKEQLDKLRFVPVYVRSVGESSSGLNALLAKGALPWPEPTETDSLASLINNGQWVGSRDEEQPSGHRELGFEEYALDWNPPPTNPCADAHEHRLSVGEVPSCSWKEERSDAMEMADGESPPTDEHRDWIASGDEQMDCVKEMLDEFTRKPRSLAEIAALLQMNGQEAKSIIKRLVDEGVLQKSMGKGSPRYSTRQRGLFDQAPLG
jgi:DNA processing protein